MRYVFWFFVGLLAGPFLALPVQGQSVSVAQADSLRLLLRTHQADTNRVKILLRLADYQTFKLGEFKADLDSAEVYAQQSYNLSRRLGYYRGESQSLNLLGVINKEAKNLDAAIRYHQAARILCQRYNDQTGLAEVYIRLAQDWKDKGDGGRARSSIHMAIAIYARANDWLRMGEAYLELGNTYENAGKELMIKIQWYRQALQTFVKAQNSRKQADTRKDLGDLLMLQGDTIGALIELRKALAQYQAIGYPELQGVYDLLGTVSSSLGDYEQGLKYGLLAVKTAESMKDSSLQLCTIYNRVGKTYYELKQYLKSHDYFVKSLRVARRFTDRTSIYYLSGNIANVFTKLNQPGKGLRLLLSTYQKYPPEAVNERMLQANYLLGIYTKLGEYTLAQHYCDQLLFLTKKLGANEDKWQTVYIAAIPFFIASKQPDQARHYIAELKRTAEVNHNLKGSALSQLYSFRLDSMQAHYPTAIKHYQLYKQLQDSLVNEVKSRQIANLDVLYETEKKEQTLKLKEKDIALLTEQSKSQHTQRNALVGGTVLLVAFLLLGYNRYRLKQRSNQKLQAQQVQLQAQHEVLQVQQEKIRQRNDDLQRLLEEKERLLKEIHHRVKNNLQVVMSLLNSQAASLHDSSALSAIQQSQHRVQAMALIHQKLYQSEGIARIPMAAYIQEVVAYLHESYDLPQPIGFDVQVEPIELDVTQAVPLGLIINEAITNALKYAFPAGRRGRVQVGLREQGKGDYELVIADDGVGLPADFDPAQSRSLGMTLMYGFSEQLGGQLQVSSQSGLAIRLRFHDEVLTIDA